MACKQPGFHKRNPLLPGNIPSLPDDTIHLPGHNATVKTIVPLPDGDRVLTASFDETARLFSLLSGKCLNIYVGHDNDVNDIALLSDDIMVSVSDDKTARLWRISDASLIHVVILKSWAPSVASLGDGRFVVGLWSGDLCAVQSGDDTDPILFKTVRSAHGSPNSDNVVNSIENISVCGSRFATASCDKTAKVWDSNTFQCLATLNGHSDWVRSVALSDTFVVTGSNDSTIRVYDGSTFCFLHEITTHSDSVTVRLVGEEGDILSSSGDETVAMHKTSTGEPIWRMDIGSPACDSAMLSTCLIATALERGKVIVYNPPPKVVSECRQPSKEGLSPLMTTFQRARNTGLPSWESCKPSDFKDFTIESKKITLLQQAGLATVWAAFAVRHDDTRNEEFQFLRECLRGALEANHIFEDELMKKDGAFMDDVTEAVLNSVGNDVRITLTIGLKARIAKFVSG